MKAITVIQYLEPPCESDKNEDRHFGEKDPDAQKWSKVFSPQVTHWDRGSLG